MEIFLTDSSIFCCKFSLMLLRAIMRLQAVGRAAAQAAGIVPMQMPCIRSKQTMTPAHELIAAPAAVITDSEEEKASPSSLSCKEVPGWPQPEMPL